MALERSTSHAILLALVLGLSACASTEETPAPESPPTDDVWAPISSGEAAGAGVAAAGDETASPPSPTDFEDRTIVLTDEAEFDWVLLKSGEYVKGEILSLDEETLTFDSDELGDLEIDWDDVEELYSGTTHGLLFEGQRTANGTILVKDDVVIVRGEKGEARYPRNELMSMVPGEPEESNFWSGKLTLGATIRRGNTQELNLSTIGFVRRRTPGSRLRIDYNGTWNVTRDITTAENHRAQARLDIFMTRRFFITPVQIEYFRDPFQNIAHRLTPGAGLGYDLIDTGDMAWEISVGAAYRYEEFVSVPAGEPGEDSTPVANLGTRYEVELSKDIDLSFEYRTQIGIPDIQKTSHHLQTTLSFDLTSILEFNITFIWDRVGDPEPDANGMVPDPNDFQLIFGLGVAFE